MTLQKHMPLVLMILALMSILPAAMVPSAIAQEDDDDENLASSIVSDVLEDGSSDAEGESNQDAANTATEDSNQEQDVDEDNVGEFGDDAADLDDANVAVPLGIPVNVQLEEEQEEPDDEVPSPEEQPEFVAFCFERENISPSIHCLDTLEECTIAAAVAEDVFGDVINPDSPCEGVETLPTTEFWDCEVTQNGEPSFSCVEQD